MEIKFEEIVGDEKKIKSWFKELASLLDGEIDNDMVITLSNGVIVGFDDFNEEYVIFICASSDEEDADEIEIEVPILDLTPSIAAKAIASKMDIPGKEESKAYRIKKYDALLEAINGKKEVAVSPDFFDKIKTVSQAGDWLDSAFKNNVQNLGDVDADIPAEFKNIEKMTEKLVIAIEDLAGSIDPDNEWKRY